MIKEDLVELIAMDTGVTKKAALQVLDSFIAQMKKVHSGHAKVELRGFGTFYCTFRKARKYVDARSGKPMMMKKRWNFKFRASKTFLESS